MNVRFLGMPLSAAVDAGHGASTMSVMRWPLPAADAVNDSKFSNVPIPATRCRVMTLSTLRSATRICSWTPRVPRIGRQFRNAVGAERQRAGRRPSRGERYRRACGPPLEFGARPGCPCAPVFGQSIHGERADAAGMASSATHSPTRTPGKIDAAALAQARKADPSKITGTASLPCAANF